jgi:tetratricopeptide (TPR) repeat protein
VPWLTAIFDSNLLYIGPTIVSTEIKRTILGVNPGSSAKITATGVLILLAAACVDETGLDNERYSAMMPETPQYVGSNTCAGCHAEQVGLWEGSHHDLAMQPATGSFVIGDFDDAEFIQHGVTTRFYQRDGQYYTDTEGADGEMAEFPVRYTFGVYPLQQYLVELPDGKLQALGVSWDSRTAELGGQRWFHVYGDDRIDYTDVLHWTQPSQNWETMCADCHSTGLIKRYDLDSDQFDTTWAEINVACEACHGPASQHLDWTESPDDTPEKGLVATFHERRDAAWVMDADTGNSKRSTPRTTDLEIGTCAPCHSRRTQIAASSTAGNEFLDAYMPALLEPPLYHVDGQIRDEVYVYGSFLQSRMYQHGVTCSDCHEPHSLNLRAPGTQVCMQCHSVDKYSAPEHLLHELSSESPDCIDCHMPATTYMQVDDRHDHSFRIPRPALSLQFGTPNACANCHGDKSAQWAADALREKNPGAVASVGHWSEILAWAQAAPFESRALLLRLATDTFVPGIVRATAISEMRLSGDPVSAAAVGERAASSDPMIRWAVARALETAEPSIIAAHASKLLQDPVLAVRIAAASALAPVDLELLPVEAYPLMEKALEEYIDAQLVNAERAESHVNIGNLQRKLNRLDKSEQAFKTAMHQNPFFVPAYVNLADLYRTQGREGEGEQLLRTALLKIPGQSALHHSLGLFLVRQERLSEATKELQLAAESEDAIPRYALAYALALDAQDQSAQAASYLEAALIRFETDRTLVAALANIYMRMGDEPAARNLAKQLQNR